MKFRRLVKVVAAIFGIVSRRFYRSTPLNGPEGDVLTVNLLDLFWCDMMFTHFAFGVLCVSDSLCAFMSIFHLYFAASPSRNTTHTHTYTRIHTYTCMNCCMYNSHRQQSTLAQPADLARGGIICLVLEHERARPKHYYWNKYKWMQCKYMCTCVSRQFDSAWWECMHNACSMPITMVSSALRTMMNSCTINPVSQCLLRLFHTSMLLLFILLLLFVKIHYQPVICRNC